MNHRFRAAFTLVEMLIVISIIATLAAMTAVATKTITEKRTIKLVEAQMREFGDLFCSGFGRCGRIWRLRRCRRSECRMRSIDLNRDFFRAGEEPDLRIGIGDLSRHGQ